VQTLSKHFLSLVLLLALLCHIIHRNICNFRAVAKLQGVTVANGEIVIQMKFQRAEVANICGILLWVAGILFSPVEKASCHRINMEKKRKASLIFRNFKCHTNHRVSNPSQICGMHRRECNWKRCGSVINQAAQLRKRFAPQRTAPPPELFQPESVRNLDEQTNDWGDGGADDLAQWNMIWRR